MTSKRLKQQVAEMRESHREQVQRLADDKERELDAVNARVRVAIGKKDEALRAIRQQLHDAELRVAHLETLLEKQRHELLG